MNSKDTTKAAVDVIAAALDTIDPDSGPTTIVNQECADAILAALAAARYTLIKLPACGIEDGDGQVYYSEGDVRVDLSGGNSDHPRLWLHGNPCEPQVLRSLAGEFVAAADHADRGQP